jgi:hypothetical protein
MEKFCKTLLSLDPKDDDLISHLYDAVDLLKGISDISKAFDPIFGFIESNPDSDFGSPGPLVHLLEDHYPKYVPRLIQSLQNKPTYITVFMLSRILNTELTQEIREQYLALLKSVASNENADPVAKEQAQEFYDHQTC